MKFKNLGCSGHLVPFQNIRGAVILVFLLLTGSFSHKFLASAQTPGALDKTFDGAAADGFLRVVSVQPDGKVLAGGNFGVIRGVTSPLIARLNSDGTSDSNFVSAFALPVLAARIYTIALQKDGGILTAGLFTNVGGTFRTNIARLLPDGSLDKSFNSGAGPSGLVRILALQPDGKILLAGEFTTVNQTNLNRIARLNADGSLDASFDPGSGANNIVRSVALLPSGQILVGGLFTSFNGRPSAFFVRLNSNGTQDTSFPAGSGPNGDIYFIAPQTNGTMLIGGDFTAVNGTNISRIARLQPDGSLDASFVPVSGAQGGPVYHVIRQTNGKIVIGGGFTSVNGVALNRLARLNTDGSLDTDFNPGSGASDLVLSLAIQNDGMLLAGGLFVTYNGTSVGMLARVFGDSVYPLMTVASVASEQLQLSWPSWASAYTLQAATRLVPADWQNVTNTAILQGDQLSISVPSTGGVQFFRLKFP